MTLFLWGLMNGRYLMYWNVSKGRFNLIVWLSSHHQIAIESTTINVEGTEYNIHQLLLHAVLLLQLRDKRHILLLRLRLHIDK